MNIDDCAFYRGDEFDGSEDPRYSDREFILEQIGRVPFWARAKLLAKYDMVYKEALAREDLPEHQRENFARRGCNTRLTRAVESLIAPSQPVAQ